MRAITYRRVIMRKMYTVMMCMTVCGAALFTQTTNRAGNAVAHFNQGVTYAEKGDWDRAIADFTGAIRLKPDYAEAYYNRGTAYAVKGDMDRAIVDFTGAIRLKPDFAEAYSNRGVAYASEGDFARARTNWEKALEINPNYAQAQYILGALRGIGY
jgi:tetratricopeptide (TPR) repeat protein